MPRCPVCTSSNPGDFDDSSGSVICKNCGVVVQDSQIVSEISFGESSSGAAVVNGSFVGQGQSGVNTGGRFRVGSSSESREATIQEGRRIINQLAAALNCPDFYAEAAQRWFTLAVTNGFTKGRKNQYVVASCLYVACRKEKSSHMLIDFSDVLGINVFILGQTYLKLTRTLNIKMPNIDPSLYIHRFAKMLEFGQEQNKVANDAMRLIKRMDRDWLIQGRRPSGICGAALLIAARMNNFRRSVREVVYIVKVADLTIHKRLAEFRQTKSGDLTVQEFRNIWLEQAHDPPSFNPKKKRRRVRDVDEDGKVIMEAEGEEASERQHSPAPPAKEPRRDADGFVIPDLPAINSILTPPATQPDLISDPKIKRSLLPKVADKVHAAATSLFSSDSAVADSVIEAEICAIVDSPSTDLLVDQLKAVHQAALASAQHSTVSDHPEDFGDVDDDPEIVACLLTNQEAEIKEKIWTEMNKEWIRDQELKKLKEQSDKRMGVHKTSKRRKKTKPRDSSAPDLPASPAEAAKEMLQRRSFSKKINYKAIEGLFED